MSKIIFKPINNKVVFQDEEYIYHFGEKEEYIMTEGIDSSVDGNTFKTVRYAGEIIGVLLSLVVTVFEITSLILVLSHVAATNSLFDAINIIYTLFNFRYIKVNFGGYQESFFDGFSGYFMPLKIMPESAYETHGGSSHGKFDYYNARVSFVDQFMLSGTIYFVSIIFQVALQKSKLLSSFPSERVIRFFYFANRLHLGIYSIVASQGVFLASRTLIHTEIPTDLTLSFFDYFFALVTLFFFSIDTVVLSMACFDGPLYFNQDKAARNEQIDKIEQGKQLGFMKEIKFMRKTSQKLDSSASASGSEDTSFDSLPTRVPIQWMTQAQAYDKGYGKVPLKRTNLARMSRNRPFLQLIASSGKGN